MTQGNSTAQYNVNQYMQGNIATGVNIVDPQKAIILKGSATKTEGAKPEPINHGLFLTDIAQAHHFTVQIVGLRMSELKSPSPKFGKFLPVKSINLNYSSYENMSIPVSIFGDFPLLNRKRVSTISLSCYDTDDNELEREIRLWENSCFPKGRYVAYMQDVAKQFIYKGYNVKGKETLNVSFFVIPSGNISVSRDYSANDAKMVNFNLVCVGDGSTCATGEPSPRQETQQPYRFKPSFGEDERFSGFENRLPNQDVIDFPNNNAFYNPDGNDNPIT